MLPKPEIGAPCNGCGLCCQTVVCSCGSFVLGLVEKYGDRAKGPCPALVQKGEGFTCGLVARPKDYITSDRGVTVLRNAVMVLIGAGAGCDEIGDEPAATADAKLDEVADRYMQRIGIREIKKAADAVYGGVNDRK